MKPKLSFSVATNPCSLLVLEALRLRTLMETALCWPVRFTSLMENSTYNQHLKSHWINEQNTTGQLNITKLLLKQLQKVGDISSAALSATIKFNDLSFSIYLKKNWVWAHWDTLSPTCGWLPPSRSLVWYGTVSFTPQSSYEITPSSDSYKEGNSQTNKLSIKHDHQCHFSLILHLCLKTGLATSVYTGEPKNI